MKTILATKQKCGNNKLLVILATFN